MSRNGTIPPVPCASVPDLQLLVDGELDGARLELVHHHVMACDACAALLRTLQGEKAVVRQALGAEDEAQVDLARDAVARVEAALGERRRRRSWLRLGLPPAFAAAAAVIALAGGLAMWIVVDPRVDAAPGAILNEARVRENAWMFQPGKVLRWVVDSDLHGNPNLPDGEYRTLQWISNVPGAEASLLRKFNVGGDLVFAAWERPDGTEVVYQPGRPDPLVVHPQVEVIRAELPRVPVAVRPAFERYLAGRANRDLSTRRTQFAERFLDAVNARGPAIIRQVGTPGGGEGYYIRTETDADAAGVRLITETYIDALTFRRYRLRTLRIRPDGTRHTEDARWTAFAETTLADFQAHDLTDLMARHTPRILDAAALAERFAAGRPAPAPKAR
jgi:hypothetical protein